MEQTRIDESLKQVCREIAGEEASSNVGKVRSASAARFAESGFPHRKHEAWKYTNLNALLRDATTDEQHDFGSVPQWCYTVSDVCLVFVDGEYREDLSNLPELAGVSIENSRTSPALVESLKGKDAATDLHSVADLALASSEHGGVIRVTADFDSTKPIAVVELTSGAKVQHSLWHSMVCEANSKAEVLYVQQGTSGTSVLANSLLSVHVQANAQVDVTKVQFGTSGTLHVDSTVIHQERDSRAKLVTITTGGKRRNNVYMGLGGEGAHSDLSGLTLGSGSAHIDNNTVVDHTVPHCTSSELYKTVVGGKAHAVFSGKVFVREHAQKTEAYQSNRNILLSDDARATSIPQLEIFADDVRCSHGSTTGQLDEEAIFYLRSRGLSHDKARALMLHSFAAEVVEHISNEHIAETVLQAVEQQLATM